MNEQAVLAHKVMLWLCIVADCALAGFLTFYLRRSWKRRLVTFAAAYGSFDFPRDEKPVGYWLTFCTYCALNILAIGAAVRFVFEFIHEG
jgi:hypothetical protein